MFDAGDKLPAAQCAVVALRDAGDDFLASDLTVLSDDQLLDVTRGLEIDRRRRAAMDAAVVAEIDRRRLASDYSCTSTVTLLSNMLLIDPAEANARLRASQELADRHLLSGEPMPPRYPVAAEALRAGEISAMHARIVTKTIEALPADVQAELGAEIETHLVDHARRFRPRELRIISRRLFETYDQDGRLASDSDRERRRCLDYRQRADGTVVGNFDLDPVTGEAFLTVMDAGLTNVSADQRSDRTPTQLRHDVFRDILLASLRSGTLSSTGGVVATILLTMTAQQLVAVADDQLTQRSATSRGLRDGLVTSGHGALLSLDALRPLLGDAQILPVVLSRTRKVEAYGDKHRIFTENQRLAMAARDLGCSFPGCTVGPAWTEAHHVVPWASGGASTVGNGTLLCPSHHRHFEKGGWQCVMLDEVPHWVPPPWLDPDRMPQRNTAHDPARHLGEPDDTG